MGITLITGQPGHGKTQWAIAQALKLAKEGRTVYAGNIRGLDYDAAGFQKLDRFEDWESLPDGSVVLWDECYDALPQRAAGRKPPPHVEALARHRHRGFDFLLVAQQTKQLDSFVSGLVERHLHARRKFGTSTVRIKQFDKWERDAEKATPLQTLTWRLSPAVWKLYESATVHTVKKSFPWYFYALPLAIAVVAILFYTFVDRWENRTLESQASATAQTGALATVGAGGAVHGGQTGRQQNPMRYTDPEGFFRPRIDGQPWTAPAYDDVAITKPPRIACMSSAKSCTCMTIEQGTIYATSDYACRLNARLGYFDPTYEPPRAQVANRTLPEPSRPSQASAQVERSTAAAGWSPIPIREPYTQPQAVPDYPAY
jgi:zona occludens toxin